MYRDDILISGKEQEIQNFKTKFKDTYKIIELGKLKRHLGIWYEWIKNEKDSLIKIHIDYMAQKIVKEYGELMHRTVKEWISPGYPTIKLSKANLMKRSLTKKDTVQWLKK